MANLTRIFTGMESGPERINDNFDKLNINWTDWSSQGIVMFNGWHGTVKYRYIQLSDIKLVCLTYNIFGDFNHEKRIFQLPTSVGPSNWIELKGNTAWEVIREEGLAAYGQGNLDVSKNQQLTNTYLYISNN